MLPLNRKPRLTKQSHREIPHLTMVVQYVFFYILIIFPTDLIVIAMLSDVHISTNYYISV